MLFRSVFVDGEARHDYLFAYKLRNIREGNLYYRQGWGWVDDSHCHAERLEHVLNAMAQAPDADAVTVTVDESFVIITGERLPVVRRYVIDGVAELDAGQRWAVAAGICIDYSLANERAQAAVPAWMCAQMSAWQFDDIPSTVLTCLDRAPGAAGEEPVCVRHIPTLEQRWVAEGDACVRRDCCTPALPAGATARQRAWFDRIEHTRAVWRCTEPVSSTARSSGGR